MNTAHIETKWVRLFAIIPSAAMTFLDQSILYVALPVIQKELDASNTVLQWTVNAYLLAIAIFVLIGGKLGDRLGHRKAYLYGMGVFVVCSVLCGISPNVVFLTVSRFFQGIGAALMMPAQTALIATSFAPEHRGRASGMIISCGSLFLILGPLIGGYLTEFLSWRWIFWINLPIAAVGFILSLTLLPPAVSGMRKIDPLGFVYFAIFSALTTTVFMQANDWGRNPLLICAVLAISAFWFLFKREKQTAHPFLDLSLFKKPVFVAINISIAITQFVAMISVSRTIYIEEILGYTPSQTGLISSISSLPVLFFSFIGGFLSDRISPRLPIAIGYSCLIFSFFWLGFFSTPSLPSLFVALLPFGMGITLIFTPSYSTAMSAVPPEKLGNAFGMVSTLRHLSASLGLSLIYLFVSVEEDIHRPIVGQRMAEIAGFSSIHLTLGVLMIIAFISVFILHGRKSVHRLPDSPAEGWD